MTGKQLYATSVALGALVAVVLAAGASSAAAGKQRSSRVRCPAGDRKAVSSTRSGRFDELVPPAPTGLVLCRYNGLKNPPPLFTPGYPAFGLVASAVVENRTNVSRFAAELNAIPDRSGSYAIACPADVGTAIIAYFTYPSGVANPVTVDLTGCQTITNGSLSRLGLDARVVAQLKSFVPIASPAKIAGHVQICGGPAPGGCRTDTFTDCQGSSANCATTDRVAIYTEAGRRVEIVRLRHARFSVQLKPGSYVLKLLEDGAHIHGRVLESLKIKAVSGHTSTVTFGISVP
jgi:hypothetical protein